MSNCISCWAVTEETTDPAGAPLCDTCRAAIRESSDLPFTDSEPIPLERREAQARKAGEEMAR